MTDFAFAHEQMDTEKEEIFLADAGLNFNFPFPLAFRYSITLVNITFLMEIPHYLMVLVAFRNGRNVELYLTFEWSSRASDDQNPFLV